MGLQLKLPNGAYTKIRKNAVLFDIKGNISEDGPVLDVGSVMRYWSGTKEVSVWTHIQTPPKSGLEYLKFIKGLGQVGVRSRNRVFEHNYPKKGIKYEFKIVAGRESEYGIDFHKSGNSCLELCGKLPAGSNKELRESMELYGAEVNNIFKYAHGSKKVMDISLEYRIPQILDTGMACALSGNNLALNTERFFVRGRRSGSFLSEALGESTVDPAQFEYDKFDITWDDIAGLDEQKEQMRSAIDWMVHPERMQRHGLTPDEQSGVLIQGPSRCGKTMLVWAAATELHEIYGDRFKAFRPTYAHLTSTFRGGEGRKWQDLFVNFQEYIDAGFSLLAYFDNLNTIGRRKSAEKVADEGLDQLLLEIERFDGQGRALIVGSTAQPLFEFDTQLLGHGRFGTLIEVPLPSAEYARQVLKIHASERRKKARAVGTKQLFEPGGLDYGRIAKAGKGLSAGSFAALYKHEAMSREALKRKGKRPGPITTADLIQHIAKERRRLSLEFADHTPDL